MKLEEIGFYTLSDERALKSTERTRLERCELLLTRRCNFACPYCRHVGPPDASFDEAAAVVEYWLDENCRNMRFSGGEPTFWKHLRELVILARAGGAERVAISTNGGASIEKYAALITAGANDFSVSLDACCASIAGEMTGRDDVVEHVKNSIRFLAPRVYTTIGTVVTPTNIDAVLEVVDFARKVGVADVRIIPSAQWNGKIIPAGMTWEVLSRFPILKYRWSNFQRGRPFRGIGFADSGVCRLALDDMAVSDGWHYPCIIYLREGGAPIGKIGPETRHDRGMWVLRHDSSRDEICRRNCLDVCVDFNNRAAERPRLRIR